LIFGWQLTASTGSPWIGIPLTTAAGLGISLVLLYLFSKVPGLRILAPMGKSRERTASK
jgi:hypothetical protein